MKDWIQKLDVFLKLSGQELQTQGCTISAELAKQKADTEFDKFKERSKNTSSPVEIHFLEASEKAQKRINRKKGGEQ